MSARGLAGQLVGLALPLGAGEPLSVCSGLHEDELSFGKFSA